MINRNSIFGAILPVALMGACADAQTNHEAGAGHDHPHYLVAAISVSDFDIYMSDYASIAIPTILEAGGEILVASRTGVSLEQAARTNWTVVVRFPSEAAANQWYHSSAYQAVIPVRQSVTDQAATALIFAPHFQPPTAE
ncbi:DUF1330 domain-containing protein [Hyphobacterium sp.]|uniref:DUF1330 domain-containing protein n=1 Tax=Hyphobacterium sp. TaxID=2004662 RepID=UPI003B52E65E